jgi:hypothetical protein
MFFRALLDFLLVIGLIGVFYITLGKPLFKLIQLKFNSGSPRRQSPKRRLSESQQALEDAQTRLSAAKTERQAVKVERDVARIEDATYRDITEE